MIKPLQNQSHNMWRSWKSRDHGEAASAHKRCGPTLRCNIFGFLVVLPVLHALPFTACTRIWLVCLSLDVQPCSFNAHFDRPSIPCPFEGFEVFLRMHLAPSETLCISLYVVWAAISTFQVSLSLPHRAISGHCLPLIIWSLDAMNGIEMHWGLVGMCYVLWVMMCWTWRRRPHPSPTSPCWPSPSPLQHQLATSPEKRSRSKQS